MKKGILLSAILAMLIGLAACSGEEASETDTLEAIESESTDDTSATEATENTIQIAVLPLSKKLNEGAQAVYEELSKNWECVFDDSGNIAKRYERYDEIGTLFCVIIDFDTELDNAVTVRISETEEFERININDLNDYFEEKLAE